MARLIRLRATLALLIALGSMAAIGAAPAAAETVLTSCTGTCGYWEVYDMGPSGKKGAVCVYATSYPYDLDEITVRPPLMHGYYSTKTKVGWRFKIQHENVNGGSWNTIYTSDYQTAKADDSIPAYVGHGFSRRAWIAPSNPEGYWYRVLIEMQWWHNGSVEGYVKLKYDWYKAQRGSATNVESDYCLQSF